jgi:hypothetical protein
MTDSSAFTKLVPGFDFLQSLVKNAGAALPGIGQWVAPTIDPAELEKRIEELRTVQFWLEQNARMLGATIQALEVQRMTLSTLKTMNVQMEDLRDSLQIRMPTAAPTVPAAPEPAKARVQEASQESEDEPAEAASPAAADDSTASATPTATSKAGNAQKPGANGAAGVVDPLQWWGALTKQFAELATTAMKDTSTDAARSMAGEMIKKSIDTASQSFAKAAAVVPTSATKSAASKTSKPAAKSRPATKAAGKGAASTSGPNKKGGSNRKGAAGQ